VASESLPYRTQLSLVPFRKRREISAGTGDISIEP
jgi:hypothetical protein